ncbi:hypothetical protein ACQPU1_04100 [Clostridium paraputrificum]|uniref:hypothetical protein n=1 Tax=Clostridium paraputrificum TaxID=29363 RepID=UPI003D35453A
MIQLHKGNSIVNKLGIGMAVAVVSFFYGGAVTETALGKFLASFGIALPSLGELLMNINSYFKSRDASNEGFRMATLGWYQIKGK